MLPDLQLLLRSGISEFGWGHPDPTLLPVEGIARATELALRRDGARALAYGAEQGPGCLIERLCAWLGQREGRPPSPAQTLITGGVSQALDLLCTLLTRPGDVVLVESPVYHLALRIFRDHGLELVPVASDEGGLRMDALEAALALLRRQGREPRFLYTVPSFCNPTGLSLRPERRLALVGMARQAGLLVLEDDVYRELWYDAASPPSLYSLAPAGPVVRLGSFSKMLAPGLRLGWLLATPEIVQRCVRSGLFDSGGGVNHFTAHVVAAFLELGLLDEHIERLRRAYRQRRDALLAALVRYLPEGCSWTRPGGGFFAWVRLPPGCDSAALLPAAEAAGVSYVPGARFYVDGGEARSVRLSFSLLSHDDLAEGVRRLAQVIGEALLPARGGG
jgi:DNA-binding transcriptional MocR family regulator